MVKLMTVALKRKWRKCKSQPKEKTIKRSRESSDTLCFSRLTYALDLKASWRFEGPACPSFPEHFQVVLLALDEQDMFVYPSQEEGLRYGVRHLLVPEVLHVLSFEVSKDLISSVMVLDLLRGRRRIVQAHTAQHDGQGVRGDLQKLLHLHLLTQLLTGRP